MLSDAKMNQAATETVKNALNKDWHRNFRKADKSITRRVKRYMRTDLGEATLSYFEFTTPLNDPSRTSPFIGFVIAVMEVQGKLIHEATPVIGKLEDNDFNITHRLPSHFCPECGAVDSIRRKNGKSGPEYQEVIYSCTGCSYKEHDVID